MDKPNNSHPHKTPSFWHGIREYFILRFGYRVSLLSQLRFFSHNLGAKHLEVAVGSGKLLSLCFYYAKWKGLKLPEHIDAFDCSEVMYKSASKRFEASNNIKIIKSDITSLPYSDNSFDTINVANRIDSFTDINSALCELSRVLKDDGRMAINLLLIAKGDSFSARLSNKVYAWCVKNGILNTRSDVKPIKNTLKKNNLEICDGYINGNTYNIILKKKTIQNEGETTEFEIIEPTSENLKFKYQEAFKRNIGWLKKSEIKTIKEARIATAGLGGVGAIHLMTLSRIGFEKFNFADYDQFELVNFNRQIGAGMSTIGAYKTSVIRDMLLDINPNTKMKILNGPITANNIDTFLEDCDIYLDSIDIFSIEIRILLFERCRQLGIPVITAAPIGMGVSYLVFAPTEYKFTDYFNLSKHNTIDDNFINFLIGLNPTLCSSRYLADPSAVNAKTKDTTSLMIGCELVAAVAATEILKIVLSRGKVYYAPYYHLFDAYLHKHKVGYLYFGNRNPLQKIKYHILKKRLFSTDK